MKLKYFGTDGVRGVANRDLSPELAFKVGRAGGYVLTRHSERKQPQVLVSRDTRISGQMLENALVAGLLSVAYRIKSRLERSYWPKADARRSSFGHSGSLLKVWQQARMDGYGRYSSYAA